MSSHDDKLRLRHMLDAAHEAMAFVADATREQLDTDIKLLRALSMSIGIIGEAASQVSTEFREAHPEIPWRQIIGMRNFLFHAYFQIDHDILWDTATVAVPELVEDLSKYLSD